jgi:hypothetical protein
VISSIVIWYLKKWNIIIFCKSFKWTLLYLIEKLWKNKCGGRKLHWSMWSNSTLTLMAWFKRWTLDLLLPIVFSWTGKRYYYLVSSNVSKSMACKLNAISHLQNIEWTLLLVFHMALKYPMKAPYIDKVFNLVLIGLRKSWVHKFWVTSVIRLLPKDIEIRRIHMMEHVPKNNWEIDTVREIHYPWSSSRKAVERSLKLSISTL